MDELSYQLKLPKELRDEIIELTADYTFARYPDVSETVPYEEYNEEIAREKVKIAEKVFEVLRDRYKSLLEEKT